MLKDSMLSNDIKNILKTNINKYPNDILDGLLESLSRESIALEDLGAELLRFDADSKKRWDAVADFQKKEADKFVEETYQSIVGSSV